MILFGIRNKNMKTNLVQLKKVLKAKTAIVVDNRLIKHVLGFDDMRDFVKDIGDWGYTSDFTYCDYQTENWQNFLRRYLKENFLD